MVVSVQWNPWSQINSHFRLSTVRSIEKVGRELVYDREVDDAHCFIADGLSRVERPLAPRDPAAQFLPENSTGEIGWVQARDGEDW
jgi:hypothetical protein